MKRLFHILTLIFVSQLSIAQSLGIGTDAPDVSSSLEIASNNKGILGPRISLNSSNLFQLANSTLTEGIFVYNTNSVMSGGAGKGYYVWTGIKWEKMASDHDWYTVGSSSAPESINDNIYTNGNVGISETNPNNKLDVAGYIKLGDQNSGDNDNEGAMRYNSYKKCMEFYDGNTWRCIGEPGMETIIIRDGVNQALVSTGSNLYNWTGGYGFQNHFTVNNVRPNSKILFLIEMVSGTGNTRVNAGFLSSYKLRGNGIWQEFDQVLTGNNEAQTQVIWGITNNTSIGNLNFVYESNGDYSNVKITAITF